MQLPGEWNVRPSEMLSKTGSRSLQTSPSSVAPLSVQFMPSVGDTVTVTSQEMQEEGEEVAFCLSRQSPAVDCEGGGLCCARASPESSNRRSKEILALERERAILSILCLHRERNQGKITSGRRYNYYV